MSSSEIRAVIPARFASTRFPGKPLASIAGVPLILRVAERVALALGRSSVIVATESQRIAEVVREAGFEVRMTSSDCPTGTDRVWEAVKSDQFEMVLNVQGDEPLVSPEDIRAVLEASRRAPGTVINAMCRITEEADVRSPNVPKVVVGNEGRLLYMSRAPVPASKTGAISEGYYRQVCIYAFPREHLASFGEHGTKGYVEAREDIEILRFLELGIPVHMIELKEWSVAVDVPEDVPRVERLMTERA